MADNDFQMPPSQRREPKRFEPPPWEKDAFDEMERRRREAEEEERRAAAALAEPQAQRAAARQEEQEEVAASSELKEPRQDKVASRGGAGESAAGTPGVDVQKPERIDQAQLTAMLAELAAEEPRDDKTISSVTLVVSIAIFALGAMMIMWGMAAFVAAKGAGSQGTIAGSVLFLFGAGFIGGAIYLAVKSLQKRGVL